MSRTVSLCSLLSVVALSACVADAVDDSSEITAGDLVADLDAHDTALELEEPAVVAGTPRSCTSLAKRIAVSGGTAYLSTRRCNTTRTGSVVNECTGSNVEWRVKSAATGQILNTGLVPSCQGHGIGSYVQQIRLEVLGLSGWGGLTSH